MNEFTKEELKYLYSAIYERPHYVSEQMDNMRTKIQSMIDNYCEHEICGLCNRTNCEECPCR